MKKKSPNSVKPAEISPIVAIGASAGGLSAIIQFFTHVPNDSNMVFVVITHLSRDHKSIMPELIQAHTSMPVIGIKEGCRFTPNIVYVIPPNKNLTIANGELFLAEQDEPHYTNLPIDCFFHSLALAYEKKAVAVVLSGCGSDGSLGLQDIKHHGGMVIVQSPETAEYDSMPLNAIHSGMVDEIVAPEKMFDKIRPFLNNDHNYISNIDNDFQQIFNLIQARTGNDFSGYKTSVLKRRIERQLRRLHMNSLKEYIPYLRVNVSEVEHLFNDLLIGVTSFFRDPDAFNELKQFIIPKLLKNKPSSFTFRAWVPGCSTGQEAYSIAILLREYMKETNHYFLVQLFCTDIDQSSIEFARTGIYSNKITHEVSKERLATYFTKEKTGYKVNLEIREMIVFGVQNIIQDPPFTKLDLISCRNLLIYLSAASQRKLFSLLHYSLKTDGILFLGKSESASQYRHLFKSFGNKYKFLNKIEHTDSNYRYVNPTVKKHLMSMPVFLSDDSLITHGHMDFDQQVKTFLVDEFVLPCVITNTAGDIIYTHGDLSDYFKDAVQSLHTNFLDVVKPHIKTMLIPYFMGAISTKLKKSLTKILPDPYSKSFFLKLTIFPVHHIDGLKDLIVICFDKTHIKQDTAIDKRALDNRRLGIEQELYLTKESLQSTIEELETNNEEMQSTNEEIQSINEELETSKEELQAVNEELLIVNTELQNRIEETSIINDDMNSLFNNADIAAIFLDHALNIKQFTPKTNDIVQLIPADIGRPFSHFSIDLKEVNLIEISHKVLETHELVKFEAQTTDGQWYFMKISPYLTSSNMIDGVVITFMEITQNKLNSDLIIKLNNELRDTKALLQTIVLLNNIT